MAISDESARPGAAVFPNAGGGALSFLDMAKVGDTLIFENDNTARPAVGRPYEVAGRKRVKINMFFTCGSRSGEVLDSDRMW